MSTDNAGDGSPENPIIVPVADFVQRAIDAARDAEHPATPAEVECDGSFICDATGHEDGCFASYPPAEPDAGDVALTEAEFQPFEDVLIALWQCETEVGLHFNAAKIRALVAAREREVAERAAERIAQAIEAQRAIAIETRDVIQTPLVKGNFDQQAWAYGDAARIARAEARP